MQKLLAISALLAGTCVTLPAAACWHDGDAAGTRLGETYCRTITDAFRSGALSLPTVEVAPLCNGQGLSCKTALSNVVAADHTCSRLYHLDYDGGGLSEEGYSSRTLYDLFSEACGETLRPQD